MYQVFSHVIVKSSQDVLLFSFRPNESNFRISVGNWDAFDSELNCRSFPAIILVDVPALISASGRENIRVMYVNEDRTEWNGPRTNYNDMTIKSLTLKGILIYLLH